MTKIHNITEIDTDHTQKGIEEAIYLLKANTDTASAMVSIVVRKNGTVGWSYTHLGGLSKLAILGGLEAVKQDILQKM